MEQLDQPTDQADDIERRISELETTDPADAPEPSEELARDLATELDNVRGSKTPVAPTEDDGAPE